MSSGGDSPGTGMAGDDSPRRGQTADEVFGTPADGIPTDGIRPIDPLDGFRDLLDPPVAPAPAANPADGRVDRDLLAHDDGPSPDDIWAGSDPHAPAPEVHHWPQKARRSAPGGGERVAMPRRSRRQSVPFTLLALVGAAAAATVLLVLGQ